jgi:hypothetical protein
VRLALDRQHCAVFRNGDQTSLDRQLRQILASAEAKAKFA